MSFDFMFWFFVGLGVYLIGLVIFTLIKFLIRKHRIKKDDKKNIEVIDNEKHEN